MKRGYLAAGFIVGCLLMTACYGGATGTESPAGRSTEEQPSVGEGPVQEGNAIQTAQETPPEESLGEGSEGQPSGVFSQESSVIRVLENLGTDKGLLSGQFYKAGDINVRLFFTVVSGENEDLFLSDRLGISCFITNTENRNNTSGYGEIVTKKGEAGYQVIMEMRTDQSGELDLPADPTIHITFANESSPACLVSIEGGGILEGDYYKADQISPLAPEVFSRYLCRAELVTSPTENLRLIRNTVFAAHGRRFQSESLKRYFKEQSWYRGTTNPEDFSDPVLSDIEKKNIALIQKLERRDDQSIQKDQAYALENLDFAPYLPFLDQNEETGIWVDLSQAVDCGVYVCVQGRISLPVTLTRSQWEAVRDGESVELCVNDLTGEKQLLTTDPDKRYILCEEGKTPDSEGNAVDAYMEYNYETELYELWTDSHDTVMKPVYEGDIYILKGAVTGGWAFQNQQEIFSSMTESSDKTETGEQSVLIGNSLRHNGRGYFTAVYFLGD